MKMMLKFAAFAATAVLATQAMAQITFYEHEGYRGRALTYNSAISSLEKFDRAGSIVVDRGRWEVCERPAFQGRCALLRRGGYESLRGSGIEWRVSSFRPAGRRNYETEATVSTQPIYEYRYRPNERTYDAPVNWTRAVMGPPSQRCWVERQAVPVQSSGNIGGAVAGAVVGGILGHQVGGGSGRDAATAAGVIAGAAIGNQMGGGSNAYATQDVQRCQQTVSGPPAFYEVSYTFRGREHRVQLSSPPGNSITVNERGEPRG
jgi:uncharacterized protein YcfJ